VHHLEEHDMPEPIEPFVVTPGGGTMLRGPVAEPTRILASTATTGGAFTALEITIAPGQGPPEHVHAREDEAWLILEGHFRFIADGQLLDAPEGSFVFVPRRVAHCFQNIGSTAGRVLVMFTPGGMERFYETHARLPNALIDADRYQQIATTCWMDVVGPPLARSHPFESAPPVATGTF
jgi:quercetin dioxygenase-like cupin family protein